MLRAIVRFFLGLPEWMRPPAIGATLLFSIVAVRILFALLFVTWRGAADLISALVVLLAATGAGAAGGLAYSLVGRPLRRIPRVGRYLAGIVCVGAYMAPLLLWGDKIFGGDPPINFHQMSDVVMCLAIIVLFGIVIGQSWFRPERVLSRDGGSSRPTEK